MKIHCKTCGKEVEITKYNKLAPHKDGNVRCAGSGKRVEPVKTEKNK